jgi:NAD+ kinase
MLNPLRHALLIQNVSTDPDNRCQQLIQHTLEAEGVMVSTWTLPAKGGGLYGNTGIETCQLAGSTLAPQLAIVLGGDGTFLTAVQALADLHIPMLGVNTGTLGFLTRLEANLNNPDKLKAALSRLIKADYTLEHRMMLSVNCLSQDLAKTRLPLALNDVVVKNADPSQMACLNIAVNGHLLAVYDADGVIISTPTGSTAYNLSAGGPVLSPEVEAMCITPICPHSFSAKPIVLPSNKVLTIQVAHKTFERSSKVIVAIDGQSQYLGQSLHLQEEQTLTIERSPLSIPLINFGGQADDFYLLLKNKLHWALNPRWRTVLTEQPTSTNSISTYH